MFGCLSSALLDCFFPKFCVKCGQINTYLCEKCFAEVEFLNLPLKVKLDVEDGCLDQLRAAARYQPPISQLIKTLKYQGAKDIGSFIGQLLYDYCYFPDADVVTFVPCHQSRLRERGFNQAQVIARELAKRLGIPCVASLLKIRNTQSQASISDRQQRLTQLQDCFRINSDLPNFKSLVNKKVLLVDDVVTTGSTLNQATKVLKTARVQKVFGLAVAHEL